MGLRARLSLLIFSLIAVFATAIVVVILTLARSSMYDATDAVVSTRALPLINQPAPANLEQLLAERPDEFESPLDETVVRAQFLAADGTRLFGDPTIPIDEEVIANASSDPSFRSVVIGGNEFRVMTFQRDDGRIVQAATTSEPIAQGLRDLRRNAVILAALATLAGAGLGWVVAGRFTRPIVDVANATPRLLNVDELPEPIASNRTDEIGTLVANFNELVGALRESNERQERLVADASHELRTPLTSLRMKIDFLHSEPELPAARRADVIRGAAVELESLTDLVSELVTLARGDTPDEPIEAISLDALVRDVAERARQSTGRSITVDAAPTEIHGRETMIRRAVANLIDNAIKFSPGGEAVQVHCEAGRIEVRDHGSGIAAADQPHAFERFYRSPSAHGVPGSGIGLALVKQAADAHGGEVWIDDARSGGATVGFSIAPSDRG